MPYLNVLSKFRDDVRNEARTNKRKIKNRMNSFKNKFNFNNNQ